MTVFSGSALAGLGWAQWATGQYEAALQTRLRALELFTKRGDAAGQALTLRGLGETYYGLGRYDEALEHYRLALEASRLANAPVEEGLILSNIGSTYRSQGRYAEAAEVLERALAIARGSGDRPAMAQVLTFLGIVNRALGEFDRALYFYEEALAARRDTNDRRGESQVLGNTANVYLDLGQYDRAIDLNRQSLKLAEEIAYTAQVAFAQQNLAAALSRIPRPEEALAFYQSALATFRKIDRRAQIPYTLVSIGTLQGFVLKDPDRGRATLLEALAAAVTNEDREAEGTVLYELASLDTLAGNLPSAMERFDAALKIASDLQFLNLQYQVLANRGVAARRMGRFEASIADLRASAAIVNDLRANVSSDLSKIAYIDTRQSVFHDLAIALGEAGRADEALEAAEAGRARAFADLLNQRQIRGRRTDQAPLRDLRTALSSDQASLPARGPAAASPGLRTGSDRVGEALQRLQQQNRELASLVAVESPKADEIKAIAKRLDATLVEYLVTQDALLIWVVSPSGRVDHVRTGTTAPKIEGLVTTLRRGLESPTLADLKNPRVLAPQLRALHDLLVSPILSRLPPAAPASTVVVIPHGATALVPFAALENARGVPLVERYTIAVAPSISIFRYTPAKRQELRGADAALIVSDPVPPAASQLERLPGTLQEGRLVARRIGGRSLVLTGASASESAVKGAVGGRRILHFATHGLVSPVRPVASSLVLGEGNGEDGYLRVDEIFGLELDADLVVLSGCSTGLGRLTGDGIFGLTRAFIYAGTPSVVVSNWDVSDDATAVLMDRFYAQLARGASKAHALAAAQRATRRQFSHPALWAAFVLAGEPR